MGVFVIPEYDIMIPRKGVEGKIIFQDKKGKGLFKMPGQEVNGSQRLKPTSTSWFLKQNSTLYRCLTAVYIMKRKRDETDRLEVGIEKSRPR
jgi:hypothetical protein